MPEPGPGEVRIKAVCSLISRGSEIGARYTREQAVSPEIMGYSLAGVVDALGEGVDCYAVGDWVVALAPHAEYVVRPAVLSAPQDQPQVVAMLPSVEFDAAPYWPLVSGCGGLGGYRGDRTQPHGSDFGPGTGWEPDVAGGQAQWQGSDHRR